MTDAKPKRRIVLDLQQRPALRDVMDRLHRKTGMRSSNDIIVLALKQFDANLPETPAQAPERAAGAHQ